MQIISTIYSSTRSSQALDIIGLCIGLPSNYKSDGTCFRLLKKPQGFALQVLVKVFSGGVPRAQFSYGDGTEAICLFSFLGFLRPKNLNQIIMGRGCKGFDWGLGGLLC